MPKWTKEQQQAIDEEGKNIIVSAGAGSGKTAVLSARVLRKLKSGVNINELLILTFTKAAAHEMKERIRKNIKKDVDLKNQLDMIDASYITTFDSYALSVVKKYHYLLNVSKDVSICEASIITLKKEEFLDEIFDKFYEEKNSEFLKLIGDFCIKDDTEIRNYIISISNKLDMKYDKEEYLKNYLNNFFNNEKIDIDINKYINLIKEKLETIKDELKILETYVVQDYYDKFYDSISSLINSTSYMEIKNNLNIKIPSLLRGSDDNAKNSKENINSIIKEIIELCSYKSIEDIKTSILSTKKYIDIICKIILELDNKIQNFKFENDMFEFNDIAKMAIKIVKENEEIREELKNYFKEILVDEYQDTNDLQETFINLISNNNVYMVGDIKQSIYRFRNANPYIFKNKYDDYSKNNNGIKIDLNKNFRSRKETLENINTIFNIIMDDMIGGAQYKESHQMIFGNSTYENEGKTSQNNNFEVYNYEYDKSLGYTKEEIEAFIIANDIKNKIENKYKVFDKDELEIRNIEYKDFVILMDRTTNFELYKKIFEYMHIPLNILKDETINNGMDVLVLRNILRLILKVKNKCFDEEFKYCFVSIARSFLFSYDDNDIFNYIRNNSYFDSSIIKKINNIVEKLEYIKSSDLLDLIVKEFNFYEKLIEIGNIEESLIRIEYITNLSNSLSSIGYSVYDFIEYIDNIIKKQYDIKYSYNNEDNNSVQIMTIHKSKGLEYHVCYYSGLYAKFNISDLKEKFTYDNIYGIISPYVNNGIFSTIYKTLLKDKYLKEEISEKIRLFYVALTRCKEKMILVSNMNTDTIYRKNNSGILNNITRLKYTSFDDILKSIKDDISSYITKIDLDKIKISKDYTIIKNNNYMESIPTTNEVMDIKSITIDNENIEEKSFSKKTNELLSNEDKKKMEIGKYIHYIFEIIDFKNPDLDSLNIDDFYKNKVLAFLNNDLFKDISKSKIYKEYEFIYEFNNIKYHGIIDLMLEYDDEIKIIDYKLKNIKDDNYINQLNGYKKYIEAKTNKKVSTYLYSIIDETLDVI